MVAKNLAALAVQALRQRKAAQWTSTTEVVYRHELRSVIATGAEIMDRVLG